MIVTPFGDLEFGSKDGLQDWLDSHDQQHYAERQAIALTGIPLFPRNFQGPINAEWFGRHMVEHTTLINFALPDDTVNSVSMEMQWSNEDQFYRWHQIHNLLHQRLDQALGIPA
jgi:hypothetical protein